MDRNICFLTVNFPPLLRKVVKARVVALLRKVVKAKVAVKEAKAVRVEKERVRAEVARVTAVESWNH